MMYSWPKDLNEMSEAEIRAGLEELARDNQDAFFPVDGREALRAFQAVFRCQRCDICCLREMATQDKGIGVQAHEIGYLAKAKGLTPPQFLSTYCRLTPDGHVMQYPCPFYQQGCTIYKRRPFVCRVFPVAMKRQGSQILVGAQMICPSAPSAALEVLMAIRREIMKAKGVRDDSRVSQ